jgi:hypothetical protein
MLTRRKDPLLDRNHNGIIGIFLSAANKSKKGLSIMLKGVK